MLALGGMNLMTPTRSLVSSCDSVIINIPMHVIFYQIPQLPFLSLVVVVVVFVDFFVCFVCVCACVCVPDFRSGICLL